MSASTPTALVLALCGAAVAVWPTGSVAGRLGRSRIGRPGIRGGRAPEQGASDRAGRTRARGDRLLMVAAPVAVLLLVAPELWWLLLVAGGLVLLRFRRSGPRRRDDSRRATALAVHHELLAACLDAGLPIGTALRAVADAVPRSARSPTGGPLDADPWAPLDAVAAMLELGADSDAAWATVDGDPELSSLAAAARRSSLGGAGLSDAVRDRARQLRSQVQGAARRATGRAGVLMVAPLGLCFLPAFLCLGLAPVVLALLGQLHLF